MAAPNLTREQSLYLDACRGMSAIAVMVGHGLSSISSYPAIGTRYPIQSYGVVVFFAISGFLIAYSIASRPNYSFSEYVIDRFSRIYVVLIPSLAFIWLLDNTLIPKGAAGVHGSAETLLANVLMLNSIQFRHFVSWIPFFEPYGSGRQLWIGGAWRAPTRLISSMGSGKMIVEFFSAAMYVSV